MSLVDLHVHSNASDGRFSPEEIVRKAAKSGLKYLALTDHDTVAGITAALGAARSYPGLIFIPGVEISTEVPAGEVHVLGYFIDYASSALQKELDRFHASRVDRAKGMVDKLAALGIDIDWARVQQLAGDASIGRPHVARAMLEKGYIANFEEAFEKYIGRGGPAYVERDKTTPAEAVALILSAGGLPVLAHPYTAEEPEKLIGELKKSGLVGVEAYYKDSSRGKTEAMVRLANKLGLIATGGTDYHGIDEINEVALGGVDVPLKAAESLVALAEKNKIR
jgi:predicted metal-dependent phosphoesterase TrpH